MRREIECQAPAIGPTIGGFLTENYGWQYIFFINLVPGTIMLAVLYVTLDRQPVAQPDT